jgi:hypothetical protein
MMYPVEPESPLMILDWADTSAALKVAVATTALSVAFKILIPVTGAPLVVQLTLTALSAMSLEAGVARMVGNFSVLMAPKKDHLELNTVSAAFAFTCTW